MAVKIRVIVLYGGKSAEHEISCRSAAFVLKNLDPQRYDIQAIAIDKDGAWLPQDARKLLQATDTSVPIQSSVNEQPALSVSNDPGSRLLSLLPVSEPPTLQTVVIPVLHGSNGEDGTLQGMLELAEVAYVGCDHLGSAIGMDKVVAKKLVQTAGIRVVPWVDCKRQQWDSNPESVLQSCRELGLPVFVKPVNCGSSVGVSKVDDFASLRGAIDAAFSFDHKVMIEKGLHVREIECAVMGDYDPEVSMPGEVAPSAAFYTYEAKYIDADGADLVVPAAISEEKQREARDLCKKAFQCLELYGMARVDLFLEADTELFYFNEANTIPGFTEISQFPLLWIKSGKSPQEILNRLIELALQRHATRRSLKRQR